MNKIKLGSKIMDNKNSYFIADIGANQQWFFRKSKKLIYLAKESGADMRSKFQNFQASKIVSKTGFDKMKGKLSHQANWKKSVFEVYQDASISKDWTSKLKEECDKVKIDYFTSPHRL